MTQDLTLSFSDAELQGLDAALTDVETRLVGLVGLDNDTRRRMTKMGGKSEKFCRQAMTVLTENPSLVAPGLKLPQAQGHLATIDQLRPRLVRVRRLVERMVDTEMALGSAVMTTSLKGYAQLKLLGKNQGLDGHRSVLRSRFSRVTAAPAEEVGDAA